jgi:fructose-1,6-bisphosphatase/inositol monophosphatase family enzyme
VEHKSSATDLVSDADRAAEDLIADIIRRERPEDGLLGEEGTANRSASGRRWVVDPLDGTTDYLYGYPQWAVSVALEDDEGGLAAVVLDPLRGECFRAARGQGAEVDGHPIRVRDGTPLAESLIATGFAYEAGLRAAQARVLGHVLPRVRDIRRAGAAALDLAWTAAGRVDGYYERGLKPWDWAAGRLLVAEAGGRVAELDGRPLGLAAAGPSLLPELTGLLGAASG